MSSGSGLSSRTAALRRRPKSASAAYSSNTRRSLPQTGHGTTTTTTTTAAAAAVTSSPQRLSVADLHQVLVKCLCNATDDKTTLRVLASCDGSLRGLVDHRCKPLLCLLLEHGGSPAVLKALLERGANPNDFVPSTQRNALHIAARNGLQVCVAMLLSIRGTNLEAVDAVGNTALILACRRGHGPTTRLLLQHGADPSRTNSAGQTALHLTTLAAEGGVQCARELLALSDCKPSPLDDNGCTPLLLALKHNQAALADMLLTCDYSTDTLNVQDWQTGQTALHWAVKHNSIDIINKLIEHGANIDLRDRNWQTPFTVAVTCRHRDVIATLVAAGCNTAVTDKQFNTALHLVSRDGLVDILPLLAVNADDLDIKGHAGATALMLAAHYGHAPVVTELLRHGADVNCVDRHRATALFYALMTRSTSEPCPRIIKELIRANCDVNEPANIKEMCKFIDFPQTLLRTASLEQRLYSPLEVAFLRGHVTAFKTLLRAGCELTAFEWLCDVTGPVLGCYTDLASTSSAQSVAAMIRLARRTLKQRVTVQSLKRLCRRPALTALRNVAAYKHTLLADVITALNSNVTDDVRRFLGFSELDDASSEYSCSPVTSPLSADSRIKSPLSPSAAATTAATLVGWGGGLSPDNNNNNNSVARRRRSSPTHRFNFADVRVTSPSMTSPPPGVTTRSSTERAGRVVAATQRHGNSAGGTTLQSPITPNGAIATHRRPSLRSAASDDVTTGSVTSRHRTSISGNDVIKDKPPTLTSRPRSSLSGDVRVSVVMSRPKSSLSGDIRTSAVTSRQRASVCGGNVLKEKPPTLTSRPRSSLSGDSRASVVKPRPKSSLSGEIRTSAVTSRLPRSSLSSDVRASAITTQSKSTKSDDISSTPVHSSVQPVTSRRRLPLTPQTQQSDVIRQKP